MGYLPSEVGLDRSGYLIYVSFIQGSLDLRCNAFWPCVCLFAFCCPHGTSNHPAQAESALTAPILGSLGRGEMDLGLTWACVGTP